jgi:hypothetical protein
MSVATVRSSGGALSPQALRGVPLQVPPVHVSGAVQLFPSLHPVPFARVGLLQLPVDESQVPTPWH